MKKKFEDDLSEIKRIYNFMCNEGLLSLNLEEAEYKVRLKRREKRKLSIPPVTVPGPSVTTQKNEPVELPAILAPLTGIFYRAPSPRAEPFVVAEQVVEKGQRLCIIEAMKVMNEILAERRCRIEKILVENGQLVTTGDRMFSITPV